MSRNSFYGRLILKEVDLVPVRSSAFILSICFLTTILPFVGCRSSPPSAEEMKKLIAAQLPLGSSKSQVVTFLDSRSVSHSDIQEHNEFDEEHRWAKFRIMTASIRQDTFWSKSQVLMVFYFDDSDRLTKYNVKNVNTSL